MKIVWQIAIILILSSFVLSQEAIKQDEVENITCDDYLSRRDQLRNALNQAPNATAYILVYEGKINYYNYKRNKFYYIYPHFGEAKEYIRTMKRWMTFARFPLDKIAYCK